MRLRREHHSRRHRDPLGVVLAGGLGRRIGGSKAIVELDRRPLISYPLDALWRALGAAAVVAKADTKLPTVPGVEVWIEPDHPCHPLAGIVHALGVAGGNPVMICAADMPFVTPELVWEIAHADPGGARAVVASSGGRLEPLLGCYQPSAFEPLARAAERPDVRLREAVEAIDPVRYQVQDADAVFNVNSPDDLLQAAAMLDGRRRTPTQR